MEDITTAVAAPAGVAAATGTSPPRNAKKHVTVISAGSILGRSEDPDDEPMRLGGNGQARKASKIAMAEFDAIQSAEFYACKFIDFI